MFTRITGVTGTFTQLTGTNFSSTSGQITSLQSTSGVFATFLSGFTISGATANFGQVNATSGSITFISGQSVTALSGNVDYLSGVRVIANDSILGGTFSGLQYKVSGNITVIDTSGGVRPYGQFTFPASPGTNNYILTSNGDGTTMWRSTTFPSQGIILESIIVITVNTSIASGNNGFSVGPVTVASGAVVTVPSGSVWGIF